jgi:hypothetical protein
MFEEESFFDKVIARSCACFGLNIGGLLGALGVTEPSKLGVGEADNPLLRYTSLSEPSSSRVVTGKIPSEEERPSIAGIVEALSGSEVPDKSSLEAGRD